MYKRQSLFLAIPSNVGASPLAGDLGSVVSSMTYSWSLPKKLVAPNAPVYLGLEPLSSNASWYWNAKGMVPPELVIDLL